MDTSDRVRGLTVSDTAREHLAVTLLAVADKDQSAFEELYRLTNAKLFGICERMCGNRESAEDVLHELYLLIWRRAGDWEPGIASPITWLAVIARNRAIDWRRAQLPRPKASLEPIPEIYDDGPGAEAMLIAKEDRSRLLKCINKLEARQRNAISIAFFEDVSYAEVAAHAGVPVGTAKSWIRRGLQQLRTCLGTY